MKLRYTTGNGKISVEFEGDSQVSLFSDIASFQEVFEESTCGKPDCKSNNIRYVVRTVDDNNYYELRCQDCGAKFTFGANKKGGGLFPKRKDADGKWLDNGGWTKWNPVTKQNE